MADAVPENMSRKEVADYCSGKGCPISPNRLARLAIEGDGPLFYKWGRLARYRRTDIDNWIEARMGTPKAHTSAACN